MPRRSFRLLTLGLSLGLAACGGPTAAESIDPDRVTLDSIPLGAAKFDTARGELVLEMPPIDIPAAVGEHEGMIVTPAVRVDIPWAGFASSVRTEMVDSAGKIIPPTHIHHVNVIDPQRRELFAPIALRLYAASKETEAASFPKRMFGMPLAQGQRIILKAMLVNETGEAVRGARTRVVFGYSKGGWYWPMRQVYPMQLDVLFPVGQKDGIKSFDLPPGTFEMKYVAKPAVSGTLLAMGGHLHDLGKFIEFRDVEANKVIWRGEPVRDSAGRVRSIPIGRFYKWNDLGPDLLANRTYEVRVVYENPTADTVRFGGMGVVGGVFVPKRGQVWPIVDTADASYRTDLGYQLKDGNNVGEMAMMHNHGAPRKLAAPAPHKH
ncbi:MAG TPA: hypothetical protein VJR92_11665 [Gemmatimonadaceae bacterium]|nr:hypothetical protein [Gemmatimonadaceae bacterium]